MTGVTMASVDNKTGKDDPVVWTAENEVNLFYALRNRRPVGKFVDGLAADQMNQLNLI